MIMRSRPRVFLPVLPVNKASTGVSAIMASEEKKKEISMEKEKES
jgi:hypothetical protein